MPNYDIKNNEAILAMREGGKILARILEEVKKMVKPGITAQDLDRAAETLIAQFNVASSFKGYHGFPAVLCVNINEEVVHAIPGKRVLQEGDIVSIDGGIIHKGWHSDAAVTVGVGKISPEAQRFIQTDYEALQIGINEAKPGNRTGDIGFAVQRYVESKGYQVVRDYIGHGIGRNLHEPPEVPNFGSKGKGALLVPGMTICIEPIITMGARYCETKSDGWTVITRDGASASQVEHTILITESGPEILTLYTLE